MATAAVFAGHGRRDFREGSHAFLELGPVVEVDGLAEARDVRIDGGFACDFPGAGDAVVVPWDFDRAGGVVRTAGPEDGHPAVEKIGVAFEIENRRFAGAPDAESGFTDHGGILPADSEIDFGIDSVTSVEQGPGTASAETGLFFIRPLPQRYERRDGAVHDEGTGTGKPGDIEPATCEIDAERCFGRSLDPADDGACGDRVESRRCFR